MAMDIMCVKDPSVVCHVAMELSGLSVEAAQEECQLTDHKAGCQGLAELAIAEGNQQ